MPCLFEKTICHSRIGVYHRGMPKLYNVTDIPVSWLVDDIEVQATLTLPVPIDEQSQKRAYPAVIMVAGSGPTDRDWNSPLLPGTNGSAALLARVLAEAGFMVLRYDKRPSGPQARENATRLAGKISMQSHLDELAGGVRLLAARSDVDSSHIFGLGNSEGCLHVLNYQAQVSALPLAGMMLTGAPAREVGALAHAQIAAQLATVPGGDQMLSAYDAAMADFMAGRPVNVDANLPENLKNLILGITHPGNLPFSRELWVASSLGQLEKVSVLVLIVIGKKDMQVDWQADGALFESIARDHVNIEIVYPENASHVLKHEPRPRTELTAAEVMKSYGADDTVLDTETVEAMTAWLGAHI